MYSFNFDAEPNHGRRGPPLYRSLGISQNQITNYDHLVMKMVSIELSLSEEEIFKALPAKAQPSLYSFFVVVILFYFLTRFPAIDGSKSLNFFKLDRNFSKFA